MSRTAGSGEPKDSDNFSIREPPSSKWAEVTPASSVTGGTCKELASQKALDVVPRASLKAEFVDIINANI
ncbi:hypothetical protein CRUP_027859 [Coryphaenoides rupestris]|nr:hypothetical protein CRUP_027859 [Coryphaenoides rupestris]